MKIKKQLKIIYKQNKGVYPLPCIKHVLFLFALLSFSNLIHGQNISVERYKGDAEIFTNNGTITLQPGFATGGSNVHIYIKKIDLSTPSDPIVTPAPTATTILTNSINYVAVWTANAPDLDPAHLVTRPLKDVKLAVQYSDGLGRPIQTVAKQGSLESATGNSKDIVLPNIYDNLGRETKQYLPYCSATSDGSYKTDATNAQPSFYGGTSVLSGQGEIAANAIGRTVFEPSPLGRVVEAFAPGNNWVGTYGNTNPSARGSVKAKYWANTSTDAVQIWEVSSYPNTVGQWGGYKTQRTYNPGELHKNVLIDEHNKQVIVFTDKQGKTVLKKVQLTASADDGNGSGYDGWLCTYYVYDGFGQLKASIQPEAVKKMSSSKNWTLTTDIINEQCFLYEYDGRGWVTMKKTPGISESRILYDARGRIVAVQDAKMRASNQWTVSVYDDLDRIIKTGIYTDTKDYAQLYAQTSAQTNFSPALDILTETHYDDYEGLDATGMAASFKEDWNSEFTSASNTAYPYAQKPAQGPKLYAENQVTWTKIKVLSSTGQYLTDVNIYDEDGRVVQTQSQNITGGLDVSTMQYTWSGQVLVNVQQTENKKIADGGGITVVVSKMTYDDLGRLAATQKKQRDARVNQGAMTTYRTVAVLQYDALGNLKKKELGKQKEDTNVEFNSPLETLNYEYNIRGWLLGVNRDYLRDPYSLDQSDNTNDGERFTTSSDGPVSYLTTNYFGFDLGYDKAQNNLIGNQSYAARQLDGSITGMMWKGANDNHAYKYDFKYDGAGRLLQADFGMYTNGQFKKDKVDYSVKMGIDGIDPLSAYDANGNILKMSQMGVKKDGTTALIDDLSYTYKTGTNRLTTVRDNAASTTNDKLGDFNNGSHSGDDYSYDANGNLVSDQNKDIRSVVYNFMDLPTSITVGNKIIEYFYDATGAQLQKKETDGTKITTTSYIGIGVYESVQNGSTTGTETLQYFGMEEGRVRISASGGTAHFVYDYFISDHLGNTRMILTDDYNVASPIVEASSYYPFGLKMAAMGYKSALGIANPSQYQGGNSDFEESTGWNSFALRNYDPQIGRFVQADPFDQFASPYVGMGNDPINNVDPSGGTSVDFGTLGHFTGSILADRALVTLAGAVAGYGIDRAMGGNGWKGAILGGGMALGGSFIKPFDIAGLGGSAGKGASTAIPKIVPTAVSVITDIFVSTSISVASTPESLSGTVNKITIQVMPGSSIKEESNSNGDDVRGILLLINPDGNKKRIGMVADVLSSNMAAFGINTKLRQAHFYAQISHETDGFNILTESSNYSRDRILEVFPMYFNESNVGSYVKSPHIFDRAYANRMNNGNEASGDGSRYRGRGITQLTGRENYTNFSKWYQTEKRGIEDFIKNPSLIGKIIKFYVLSGLWDYSVNLKLNKYADKDDINGLTRKLNGGTNGLKDRKLRLKRAKKALGIQ